MCNEQLTSNDIESMRSNVVEGIRNQVSQGLFEIESLKEYEDLVDERVGEMIIEWSIVYNGAKDAGFRV